MALRQEGRDAADRAQLALEVDERRVALGRAVELDDARDAEALLEALPDVRPQAVADAEAQAVLAVARVRRRVQQVAAELADVLEQRALGLATSSQKRLAEKCARSTRVPPPAKVRPEATTPPTL